MKKYDLDGNLVKTIPNLYGANIHEVSDGFIVFNDNGQRNNEWYIEMVKYDKDLNQVWYQKYTNDSNFFNYFYSDENSGIIEVEDGYIVIRYDADEDIKKIDKNGNPILSISKEKLGLSCPLVATYHDGKLIILDAVKITDECLLKLNFVVFDKDLNLLSQKTIKEIVPDDCSGSWVLDLKEVYQMNKITKIPAGYLITGEKTLVLNDNGDIDLEEDLRLVDAVVIDDGICAIHVSADIYDGMYWKTESRTSLVKYNFKLEEQEKQALPYRFYWEKGRTATATLKNTSLFYPQNGFVNVIFLNANWKNLVDDYSYENLNLRYSLQKYSFEDFSDDAGSFDDNDNVESGIIDNIFKNPETSSIAIIIIFCIVIMIGAGFFYYYYTKKIREK